VELQYQAAARAINQGKGSGMSRKTAGSAKSTAPVRSANTDTAFTR
jgi:hypothetical protein